MKRSFAIYCCLFLVVATSVAANEDAQARKLAKKQISKARDYIKSGKEKDFQEAEKLMTSLMTANSEARKNVKVMNTWYEAVYGQYAWANERMYLKQKQDTAQFFNLVRRTFAVSEALDSIDAQPDKKGRVCPDYREAHAGQLAPLRRNLYFGGIFHQKKQAWAEAYSFFDAYVDTSLQPLFTGYDIAAKDTLLPQAAYHTTYCGYMMQSAEIVLKHAELAMKDPSRLEYTMQYVCEAYSWQKNDSAYEKALRQGFKRFPEHPYFFPRLADYYNRQGKSDSVLALTTEALRTNADNELFLLARSVAQLNMKQYDECIETSQRLIELNDSMAEPYMNIATVYLNRALAIEEEKEPRKNHFRLRELYKQAKPYMETYRRLAPNDTGRWAPALYRIYLNLNMGREFDEIERVLKK